MKAKEIIRYPVRVQGPYQKNRGYEIADATGMNQIAADLTLPHAERIRLALNATRNMTDSELAKMASQAVAISIAARHHATKEAQS